MQRMIQEMQVDDFKWEGEPCEETQQYWNKTEITSEDELPTSHWKSLSKFWSLKAVVSCLHSIGDGWGILPSLVIFLKLEWKLLNMWIQINMVWKRIRFYLYSISGLRRDFLRWHLRWVGTREREKKRNDAGTAQCLCNQTWWLVPVISALSSEAQPGENSKILSQKRKSIHPHLSSNREDSSEK